MVEKEYEDKYEDEVTCPYCGFKYSDSWEIRDSVDDEECPECKKHFSIEIIRRVDYHTRPDCELNGQRHIFGDAVSNLTGKVIDGCEDAVFCKVCGTCRLKSQLSILPNAKGLGIFEEIL